MPFNTPKSIKKCGRLEKVACPQCGRYVVTGSLSRHISHTDGHSVAFFRSNVPVKSVINNNATSEIFTDFSDTGFLGNDDVQVVNFMESLVESPQLEERNAGRLEQFPNAGITPIRISLY